jgi:hypothetical protein
MANLRHVATAHSAFRCNPLENFSLDGRKMMKVWSCTATAVLLSVSMPAYSGDSDNWLPDSDTVARIEKQIEQMPLPSRNRWQATALNTYGRYYTGLTQGGHKIVRGVFASYDPRRYPLGVHIVMASELPSLVGGGCTRLDLWYDVEAGKVTEFRCYGLG